MKDNDFDVKKTSKIDKTSKLTKNRQSLHTTIDL